MMATQSTSLAFLFLVTIHFHWILPSFAFSPSSSFRNSPRFASTFTRSRLFSASDNSDSNDPSSSSSSTAQDTDIGISSNDNQDYESDDAATYYSPNAPLREKDTDTFNGADGSESEYSFFDEAVILVRSGSGGQGASTFKLMAGGMDGAPDGGSGGTGGNIILETDSTLNSLAGLTQAWRPNSFGGSGAASSKQSLRPKSFRAENGSDGDRQYKNGKFGTDIVIRVPPGTIVQEEMVETDIETDEETVYLIELGCLSLEEKRLVVAFGGEGGEGSGAQGKNRSIRRPRAPPTGGQRKMLKLTLKIVADVALVGVPNAGKSTFLASVTRAKPKIANVSCC
jgi:GTP-binding protein